MLYDRIGVSGRGLRLTSESLCDQCVINRSRQMKLSQSIAGDTKFVQDLLKEAVDERLIAPLRCIIVSFNCVAFKLVVFVCQRTLRSTLE